MTALLVAEQDQPVPSFRSSINTVSLNVTVTDQSSRCFSRRPSYYSGSWDGCLVADLNADAFEVFEDGVEQDVSVFHRGELPVAISVLIDASLQMKGAVAQAKDAAIGFTRKLRSSDLAEVVSSENGEVLQSFTNDRVQIERAIRSVSEKGPTSIFRALYVSLKRSRNTPFTKSGTIRRQAIVLLTSREDTSNVLPFVDLVDLARRSETAIYAIGLTEGGTPSSSLRQLAIETGGRSFFPGDPFSLGPLYSQIHEELSSQYTIGYSSTNSRPDGTWRRVFVRVNYPSASARARQGYFAVAQ